MNKNNVYIFNRKRAIKSLVGSLIVVIITIVGLSVRLSENPIQTGYTGAHAFRMFTIDSNLLVFFCALLSIPYQIDGIRTGNFHMPRWIVYTLYVGVCAVTLTFLIAVAVLSPIEGYKEMLLMGSNLFYHLINPIFAIILYIFFACDHHVKFKYTFYGMIPAILYSTVYAIMVFAIGEANGGWSDHYRLNAYMPWPLTYFLAFIISFGINTALRESHNGMHKREKRLLKEAYFASTEFNSDTIEEAVIALAQSDKVRDPLDNEITVPRRIIKMLIEKYNSDKPLKELCELYLKEYLN